MYGYTKQLHCNPLKQLNWDDRIYEELHMSLVYIALYVVSVISRDKMIPFSPTSYERSTISKVWNNTAPYFINKILHSLYTL